MKNLKTFENYEFEPYYSNVIKQYGDFFPLTKLSKGDKVVYLGSPCTIEEVDEYIMKLIPDNGGNPIMVNQNMFKDKGFISKQNKPQNYNG
jgi:hypothetical protein